MHLIFRVSPTPGFLLLSYCPSQVIVLTELLEDGR